MISGISSHLYPWNKHPASKITTIALCVSVVAAILLTLACSLNWGAAAYGTLGGILGLSLLVISTVRTTNKCEDKKREEVAREKKADVAKQRQEMTHTLYGLVKAGKVREFKQALKSYDQETLSSLCDVDAVVNVEEGIGSISTHQSLLFKALLNLPDATERAAFLTATLEAFEDHTFHAQEYVYSDLLKEKKDARLIQLVLEKFNQNSLFKLFDRIVTDLEKISSNLNPKIYSSWLDALIDKWPKDLFIRKAVTNSSDQVRKSLIKSIENARILLPDEIKLYKTVLDAEYT